MSDERGERVSRESRTRQTICVRIYLVGHDVSEKTSVSRVDSKSVRGHGVVNLLDNRRSSGLDPENGCRLHDLKRKKASTTRSVDSGDDKCTREKD